MMELFRQAQAGWLSLDDRRCFEGDTLCRGGSQVLGTTNDVLELTLREYCRLMIAVSDNTSTDFLMGVLVETMAEGAVNSIFDDMGCTRTRTPVTMGRYHYRMAGLGDDVPTCPANDELQRANSNAHGHD